MHNGKKLESVVVSDSCPLKFLKLLSIPLLQLTLQHNARKLGGIKVFKLQRQDLKLEPAKTHTRLLVCSQGKSLFNYI